MHVAIAMENVWAGWKWVGIKSSTARFVKLCLHAKLYQMVNIIFICFAVRLHEHNIGMDVYLGGLRVISLHVKLKCAKSFINSSTILFLNVRSELQVAFSRATVFWTEISLKWRMWFILIKSLTLKIPIPNSMTYLFLWLTTVFLGVQGSLVKNKTLMHQEIQ
jgi:hypothetical protein